ncbi:MAG: hypothetical protein OEY11_07750 [Gammaproteobacteria bacterium]|nr:hypothetical protein [Gammaproteobacteria bacterium]
MSLLTSNINKVLIKVPLVLLLLMLLPNVSPAVTTINGVAYSTVSGVVYGGSTPLENVDVKLIDMLSGSTHAYKKTGPDGTFSFVVADGNYRLQSISQPDSGYGSSNINDVTISAADEVLDVYLLPAGINLNGIVYHSDGITPASDIELKIFDVAMPDAYIDTAITDAQGHYSFSVSAGSYGLYMKASGSFAAGLNFTHTKYKNNILLDADLTHNIVLPFISVSGKTIDNKGGRLPGVEINVTDLNQTTSETATIQQSVTSAISDSNGDYSLYLYPFSNYEITLIPPVEAVDMVITSLKNVDLSASTNSHDFTLMQGVSLSGKVYLPKDNTPAKDVVLKIFDIADSTNYLQSIVTDSTGKYSFSVAPGVYGIYIEILDSSNTSLIGKFISTKYLDNISVVTNTSRDIQLPFVTIAGSTIDANGTPVAGVSINLESSNLQAINSGETIQFGGTVISDSSGNYSFNLFPHSDYNISLVAPGSVSNNVTPLNHLDLSVTNRNLNLQFKAGFVLSGTVYLPDGTTPASQVELKVFESANPGIYLDSVITDATGHYSFPMASGSYGLYMKILRGGNTNILNDFISSRHLDAINLTSNLTQNITLPLVQINGRTLDGNGVAVAGVDISVEDLYPAAINGGQVVQYGSKILSDANGQFVLNTYPGTNYTLSVSPPSTSGFATLSYNTIDFSVNKSQVFVLPFDDILPPNVIAGPVARYITDKTAFIEWMTDEPTTTALTLNGVAIPLDETFKIHHSVAVSNLTASTMNYYTVFATDVAGHELVENKSRAFFTKAVPDLELPVILSGPTVTAISDTTALVRWTTNEPTDSSLSYGETNLSSTMTDATFKVSHEFEITGLTALTSYNVQIHATDFNNNGPVYSPTIQFNTIDTPDTEAPIIISGPFVSNVTDTGVSIIWQTNEPASSGVSYNDGTAYNVYNSDAFNTEHEVTITGLIPSTLYNFVVSLTDQLGNGPTLSTGNSFLTLADPDLLAPVVTEPLKVVGVTHRSAVIIWRTDEPADSVINYGLNAESLDLSESKARLKTKHRMQLVNLSPNTTYYLKASSTDIKGNVINTELVSVTTRSLPDVAGPRFTETPRVIALNNRAATIYWETDEPSDSTIKYGKGGAMTHRHSSDHKTQHHQISITGLEQNEAYTFEVESTDSEGNLSRHNHNDHHAGVSHDNRSFFIKQAVAELGSTNGITTDAVADTTAPELVIAPEVVAVASNYAILHWVTGEPANSVVQYSQTGGALNHLKADLEYATDHLVVITNLSSNTNYDLKVSASDLAGNQRTSNIITFTTAATVDNTLPSFLTDVSFSTLSETELSSSVQTDEYTSASIRCSDNSDSSVYEASNEGLHQSHVLYIAGLNQNSEYSCEITIKDIAGNEQKSQPLVYTRTVVTDTSSDAMLANPIGSDSSTTTVSQTSISNSAQSSGSSAMNVWYILVCLFVLALVRPRKVR